MDNAVILQWLDSAGSVIGQYALPTPLSVDTMKAVDWSKVLGTVNPPPVVSNMIVNNAQGLNLRAAAGRKAAILETLANGAAVSVLSTPVVQVDGLTWAEIVTADGKRGWAASEYLVKAVVTPPKPVTANKTGLHFLQDGRGSAQAFLDGMDARNKHIASATVVNDVQFASDLANKYGVPYVIYRTVNGDSPDGVSLPGDAGRANQAGRDWVTARWNNNYANAAPNVYLQFANELVFQPHHGDFWLGMMQECDARGRKAAIGAYAVGNLEEDQILTMVDALAYAKAYNHLFCLHAYGKDGNPPGQLSGADSQYYELRYKRLYARLPERAQPHLCFSECACEFHRGKFQGVEPFLNWAKVFGAQTVEPFVVGFNLWTVGKAGGWDDACIDSALPDLARSL